MAIGIILPNQNYEENPLLNLCDEFYIIEECLFFKQYNFHKQKLLFHRSSMKFYEQYLLDKNKIVHYVSSSNERADIRLFFKSFKKKEFFIIDPIDDWILKRIRKAQSEIGFNLSILDNPSFLNHLTDLNRYFDNKENFHQTNFYKECRKSRNILIDKDKKPVGGKWTFDVDNRKKYPKNQTPPSFNFPKKTNHFINAVDYIKNNFFDNLGEIYPYPLYPTDFDSSKEWLQEFLENRFFNFGKYEDAILKDHHYLNHSVISPLLNSGLLTPKYVIDKTLSFAENNKIPINSVEGFIRQILGWREFVRGVYLYKGTEQRNSNFWNLNHTMPKSFYEGTTGILPIDKTIHKILKTGYAHHIERLMILSNFMLLCRINPSSIYQWFMELFIDAYDWVMVPNVYGMSQFADGGLMSTKPYISGSNYLLKMSDYKKGDWCVIWDSLFWKFVSDYGKFFEKNPRTKLIWLNLQKKDKKEIKHITETANQYLQKIHS